MSIYRRPKGSQRHPEHKIYPYLLRDVTVERVNHVWSADIIYIRPITGFHYLVAILDWFSRYVLSRSLSNTLDCLLCVEASERALRIARPQVFNTDQGSQFTRGDFTSIPEQAQVAISVDGRDEVAQVHILSLRMGVNRLALFLHVVGDSWPATRDLEITPSVSRHLVGGVGGRLPAP